jgi:hypothetical protein
MEDAILSEISLGPAKCVQEQVSIFSSEKYDSPL